MTTLATTQPTLLSLANQMGADGSLLTVAEVLNRVNPMIPDAPWIQANDVSSHKDVRRLSLPSGTWRQLNKGVALEGTETIPIVETIGMLETYSQCDKDLVNKAPNPMTFRDSRAKAFLEGLSQTLATALISSNSAINPEQIMGLQPRLDSLTSGHVISCSGTGQDLTSLYIVQWGENRVHLIYPRGSATLGIDHKDLGELRVDDGTGKYYQAYVDHFQVNIGLAVLDDRCLARVCNIETAGSTNLFDEDKLIQALNELPYDGQGAVIYCNKTVMTQMQIAVKDKGNILWTPSQGLGGTPVLTFMGYPVRRCDAITNSESTVS